MKLLLIAINARYVHTNLAIRSLSSVLKSWQNSMGDQFEIQCKEFTINEHMEKIAALIYEEKPNFIGFSCYIWNIVMVLALVRRLKIVLPETRFFLGGPEVSFDPVDILQDNPPVDAVITGEGEFILPELLKSWMAAKDPQDVPGLVWRKEEKIVTNALAMKYPDLNQLPNPYAKPEDLSGRLVYVETTRGCPFNCSFCISSTHKGVRYLDPDRFREVLQNVLQYGARTVKFVDRTFNVRRSHALEILNIFKEEAVKFSDEEIPRAHCEMAGELLDEEWLEYLKAYPKGMLQLEIGVQSTYQPTLEAIARKQNFDEWREKVRIIQHDYNIPVHLDLIAGLPKEGLAEFKNSFNAVYGLQPDCLQLGFLKVLKGSEIWVNREEYGIKYLPDPPYTVLETKCLNHRDILELAKIEDLLEKYYNSGIFSFSLRLAESMFADPFVFYQEFASFWQEKNWFNQAWKQKSLFEKLWLFIVSKMDDPVLNERQLMFMREALKFDYYLLERPGNIPDFLLGSSQSGTGNKDWDINDDKDRYRRNEIWEDLIPESRTMDKRQWARATAIDYFEIDIPRYIAQGKEYLVKKDDPLERFQGGWYLFYYGKKKKFFKCES